MDGKGPPIDEAYAIFSEQAVIVGVVDKLRNKELRLRPLAQILLERAKVTKLRQS